MKNTLPVEKITAFECGDWDKYYFIDRDLYMRYWEIITEGRDASLFHGTGIWGATQILTRNAISAKTAHDSQRLFQNQPLGSETTDNIAGVSLTRNKRAAEGFGDVVFEIDQRKLSQRYKFVPIDYWAPYQQSVGKPTLRAHNPHPWADKYEFEEFCIGTIKPLDRYLISISITQRRYERALKQDVDDILMKHLLLKVDGRFVHQPLSYS